MSLIQGLFSLSGHDYIVDYACETVENYKGVWAGCKND